MSKFINKNHINTINNISDSINSRLKAPYFVFNDKNVTISTYYNINDDESSKDENILQEYNYIGDKSPIRFNKVLNTVLYGIPRIEVDLDITDNGLESSPITGEAYILPDTIIPKMGDYFIINYLSKPLLFRVTKSTPDTIDNNFNFYRISYEYDKPTNDDIEKQVCETFVYLIEHQGTEYNSVIKKNDYDYIDKLDDTLSTMREYYKVLFYSERVQAFIYNYNTDNFYDPYCVEFIIRNNLISTDDDYLYITQQVALPRTFPIDYSKSIFYALENDKGIKKIYSSSQANYINDVYGIFSIRSEPYFRIQYNKLSVPSKDIIQFLDKELLDRIESGNCYDINDDYSYRNIIIKHFNKMEIQKTDIDLIEEIDYVMNMHLFYELIMIIYIIEKNIKKLMK